MQITGLVGLERLVLGRKRFRLQVAQIAHAMAAQTAVEAGARGLRVQELPHHREQVVERHQQRPAQGHRNRLLRRGQRRLQLVRRVAAVVNAVAMFPFVNGLLGRAEALRQRGCRLSAGLNRSPHLWRRRCLLVKMDQHARTPLRMSLRIDLAMKNEDRRGSM